MLKDITLNQINLSGDTAESCYYGRVSFPSRNNVNTPFFIGSNYRNVRINGGISQQFIIPGLGQKPVNCVGSFPRPNDSVCSNPDCAYIKIVTGNCKGASCPDCFQDWIFMRCKTAVERILSYKLSHNLRCGHFVVSLSEKQIKDIKTIEDLEKVREDVRCFLRGKGIIGAVEVFHPFRFETSLKGQLLAYRDKNYPKLGKYGIWKSFVELVKRGDIKNWRDWLTFRPHFHFIGVFKWTYQANDLDPFVFKKVGADRRNKDIVKTVMYLYSHVGIDVTGAHNIRWIGQLGNCRWSLIRASAKIQEFTKYIIKTTLGEFKLKDGYGACPVCGAPMYDLLDYAGYIKQYKREDQRRIISAYCWLLDGKPRDLEKVRWISGEDLL